MTEPSTGTPPKGTMVDDLRPSPRQRLARKGRWMLGLLLAAATAATGWGLWHLGPGGTGSREAPTVRQQVEDLAGVYERGDTLYVPTGEVMPGVVFVDSRPDGLEVRLDGASIGRTPLVLDRRQTGDTATVELMRRERVLWRGRVPVLEGGIRVEVDVTDGASAGGAPGR